MYCDAIRLGAIRALVSGKQHPQSPCRIVKLWIMEFAFPAEILGKSCGKFRDRTLSSRTIPSLLEFAVGDSSNKAVFKQNLPSTMAKAYDAQWAKGAKRRENWEEG